METVATATVRTLMQAQSCPYSQYSPRVVDQVQRLEHLYYSIDFAAAARSLASLLQA